MHLGALAPRGLEAEPQLHALHRRDGHQGLRQAAVQLRVPRDVGAEPDGSAQRDHLDHAAQRIARGLGRVDPGDHLALRFRVEAAHGAGVGGGIQGLGDRDGGLRHHPTQFHDVRTDFHAELFQQHLAHRAAGDARHRLARARPLQDVARVLAVVLERAGEIRVAGPRTRHLAAALATGGVRFGGHHVLPVLPIAVPHEHRDGGAQRLAGTHPGEPLDLVGFDFHAGTAPVAAHPPLQLGVDALGGQGQAGGDPFEDRHQPASVRLARRREPEHHRALMLPDNSTRARLRAGLSRSPRCSPSARSGAGVRG